MMAGGWGSTHLETWVDVQACKNRIGERGPRVLWGICHVTLCPPGISLKHCRFRLT